MERSCVAYVTCVTCVTHLPIFGREAQQAIDATRILDDRRVAALEWHLERHLICQPRGCSGRFKYARRRAASGLCALRTHAYTVCSRVQGRTSGRSRSAAAAEKVREGSSLSRRPQRSNSHIWFFLESGRWSVYAESLPPFSCSFESPSAGVEDEGWGGGQTVSKRFQAVSSGFTTRVGSWSGERGVGLRALQVVRRAAR